MGAYKLTTYEKDSFPISGTITKNSVAYGLTGATICLTVKSNWDLSDGAASILKTGTVIDPSAGTFLINLDSSNTAISPGKYIYDIQVLESSNTTTTLLTDTFEVLKRVKD